MHDKANIGEGNGLTQSLVVESDQLTASVPELVREEVGGVNASATRINTRQLTLIVVDELYWVLLQQVQGLCLHKRRHLVAPAAL